MNKFIRIGIDLGKNHFQVHALESEDGRARTRQLSRQAMRKFFSEIEPCFVGMEACASSHYWARETFGDGSRRATDPAHLCQGSLRGHVTARHAVRSS